MSMQRERVLIVDDDAAYASKLAGALAEFHVDICHTETDFREHFVPGRYDLLIVDMRLSTDREGLRILREALKTDPWQAAIVITAYADMETYADALDAGALTYLDKAEFSPTLIARTVEAIIEQARLRRRLSDLENHVRTLEPLEIIGVSPAMRRLREEIRRSAESDLPTLLIGEPGTGKELAARNIHRLNRRRSEGPFVRAVCEHGPHEDLIERLFGTYTKKAREGFPTKKGWIEEAHTGILFVDGPEGLNPPAWAALLSLLQKGWCQHPLADRKIEANIQIILATKSDGVQIERRLPPDFPIQRIILPRLHEHREDIPLLAQYILHRLYRDGHTQVRSFRGTALALLEQLPWIGNVRELQSAIAYAAVRADAAGMCEISAEHIPAPHPEGPAFGIPKPTQDSDYDYRKHLARAELGLAEWAIEAFGPITKTDLARRLGYNDRFIFARRIRKILADYPQMRDEFPRTIEMMTRRHLLETNPEGIHEDRSAG